MRQTKSPGCEGTNVTDQKGWALWLTGLPASGKTTIALALQSRLSDAGIHAIILDSDDVRKKLAKQAQECYEAKGRQHFYDTLVDLAEEYVQSGANVIIAATGHRRSYRQRARDRLTTFAEVWIQTPKEIASARDAARNPGRKGLYARAYDNEISNFPGVHEPYEEPEAPEVVIDTTRMNAKEATEHLLASLDFLKEDFRNDQ